VVEWSAADGDFLRHCPTNAIKAARIDLVTPGTADRDEDPDRENLMVP
jgi:hypothetical protein